MKTSRRSYARRSAAGGPALPGFEDAVRELAHARPPALRIRIGSEVPRPPAPIPAAPPPAIPAAALLSLHAGGRLELAPLLALVCLRAKDSTWRVLQREAAVELGTPLRTFRRHEIELVRLGLVEVSGRGPERCARVIHKVLHTLSTIALGVGGNRPPVAGSMQAIGTRARADSELKSLCPVLLSTPRARSRAPLPAQVRSRLGGLPGQLGLWSNVLPEAEQLSAELALAWGEEAVERYLANLAGHVVSRFEEERRGRLFVGALRARVNDLGRPLMLGGKRGQGGR